MNHERDSDSQISYTLQQAAEILFMSTRSLQRRVKQGLIEHETYDHRRVLFRPQHITAYRQAQAAAREGRRATRAPRRTPGGSPPASSSRGRSPVPAR